MFFEKLLKWVTSETNQRSGVLTSPTALVFDSREEIPVSRTTPFKEWADKERRNIPRKAVASLQIYADAVNALVIDVEKRQVTWVDVPIENLGEFTTLFLTADRPQLRTILQAPRWLVAPRCKPVAATSPAKAKTTTAGSGEMHATTTSAMVGDYPPDAAANGLRPGVSNPPDPPRIQALVELAEQTAGLQVLPVLSSEPLEN